jgi:hypothetical protein
MVRHVPVGSQKPLAHSPEETHASPLTARTVQVPMGGEPGMKVHRSLLHSRWLLHASPFSWSGVHVQVMLVLSFFPKVPLAHRGYPLDCGR